MSYATQAGTYREMEVLSASPGQLVVMLYDHLLVALRRTHIAMEAHTPELRSSHLDRARLVITELLATLDREAGGEVAENLNALYTFFFTEMVDLGLHPDVARLGRVTAMVADLRDAFAQAAGVGLQGVAS